MPMLTDKPVTDWQGFMKPANSAKLQAVFAILQKEVDARVSDTDLTPLKVYISGPTGLGKTTLAKLIGRKLIGAVVNEIESGELLEPEHFEFLKGNSFCWRVLIVNEAQLIRRASVKAIMGGLDAMGKRSVCLFTTMEQSCKAKPLFGDFQVDRAITDRCLEVALTNQGIKSPENVAKVLQMARESGLDFGATEQQVSNLFEAECNSIRGVLAAISRGALAS